MKSILIVGAETVVGANLAAEACKRCHVLALTDTRQVTLPGCEMLWSEGDSRTPHTWLGTLRPDAVVLCGPASDSSWLSTTEARLQQEMVDTAGAWADAAHHAGAHFTFISSDAVFTGPWMFHDEESTSHCATAGAQCLQAAERHVQECHPEALIVRTNAFGWAPSGTGPGWIEQILIDLERRSLHHYDFIRHATPILATDLAEIILRAQEERLTGIHHVAGAERISPLQFAQRLADHFELPWLAIRRAPETLQEPAVGFGAGETSLQTKKIRKALCVAMPMLSEGLTRLRAQQVSGFREQLGPDYPAALRQTA